MNKVELLAPASGMEKIKIALMYGADAVYFGGDMFNARKYASNFNKAWVKTGCFVLAV